ncbi:putative ditrans,polycis-polyprenyl diphosphate synthase ((2E,6E)-farnesyl diphosphate specific) [Lupinus albus]|uniref:ditrans,polycis-polyprenyl diphosphate synthase [(2E,6E)-farnesyldiphosphate specific] n=1 Tax=Lupinus albus TaxID=3870 RepID=A0A6A4P4D2_LUPAL|nr:putative ditrans,polycis-polyprenyl diphosphate synthase ((2E,6E)-farnesyl diphosphate specific) [Lupinus albus]
MDLRSINLSHRILTILNLGLPLVWYFLHIIVTIWYSILAVPNFFESYFISYGVFNKYKSLHLQNLRYLAIVIESEDAHHTSNVVQLLHWLHSIGVNNVCLYDMNGVLKKSKEAIFQKLKIAKSIEETNEVVTKHVPDHMTLEFVSYVDGKEAVAKAANLIFRENLNRRNLCGELSETHLNEALQIVGCKGPEPDLLLVYGPVRCHLGFPAWRMRYTEIVHMGSLSSMRYGSLMKAIYIFTKVHQNYGT